MVSAMVQLGCTVFFACLSLVSAQSFSFPDCTEAPLNTNDVCNTSLDPVTRATALVNLFNNTELIANTVSNSTGVPRLGLGRYNWWNEALHGVAYSPGLNFGSPGQQFGSATSFPQPILMSAAFDDDLIEQVANVISTEQRAFSNAGRGALDFWTPNINPFKDPRWGRGQETPGEDPFRLQGYVNRLIRGLQGGFNPDLKYLKVAATCKHYAGYDLESWNGTERYGFNALISQQELVEYYLPVFQTCVRDAKVEAVMCSYNAINGIPTCADSFLLQTLLRDTWGLPGWVVSDCDAVANIFDSHHYTSSYAQAAGDALNAGVDVDCGYSSAAYANLPAALSSGQINVQALKTALIRQYTSLVRLGYFDPASVQPFRQLTWSDVNTTPSQVLAKQSAVEGIVLLKNDGTLPITSKSKKIAFIGPWANATGQMQGNYNGGAPFLISPLQGLQQAGLQVTYTPGTNISSNDTSNFGNAISVALEADIIVYAGGIDGTIENEGFDRTDISWPSNQLALIQQLAGLNKPLVVVVFGGGQLDSTWLKNSASVRSIVWAGYPGQSGGSALADILTGVAAPAGRLPLTQYPAQYTSQIAMTNMALRPTDGSPGRTYRWYNEQPVYPFGFGLHYTNFKLSWATSPTRSKDIPAILAGKTTPLDAQLFENLSLRVTNTGSVKSDFVATVYLTTQAGPPPYPNSQLVSYAREKGIGPGENRVVTLPVTIGSISRIDANGNSMLYPGSYAFQVDVPATLKTAFTLTGPQTQILAFPQRGSGMTTPPPPPPPPPANVVV